jgi:hypothetical protein
MKNNIVLLLIVVVVLIVLVWTVGIATAFNFHEGQDISPKYVTNYLRVVTGMPIVSDSNRKQEQPTQSILPAVSLYQPKLLSRSPEVSASCDARGNLGPCEVIIQSQPGTNWLKDRWQAASDMGGTAIPGHHWVILDFKTPVIISRVQIDWETAYAKDYRLEGRLDFPSKDDLNWNILYDATIPEALQM